jgi:hypothetical protein
MFATATPALAQSAPSNLVIDVRDHGATGNGATDDTDSIYAALDVLADALEAIPEPASGTIVFPAGIYRITRSIELKPGITSGNITIAGTGRFSSRIKADGNFSAFNVSVGGCEIRDLQIVQFDPGSDSAAITVIETTGIRLDNLVLKTSYAGIICRGGSGHFISNIYSTVFSGTLILLEGTDTGIKNCVDIFIDTVIADVIGNSGYAGIIIKDVTHGLYISKVALKGFAYGMRITGNGPGNIFCNQVISDSCTDNAFQIESGITMRFSQCWGSSSNNGFRILGGYNIWLDGCTAINNKFDGVYVNTSGGVHIRNSQIARNSQNLPEAHHGIYVCQSISGVTVEGCRLGSAEPYLEKQGYGAFFDGGSNSYIATGNDARGNIVGGIFSGGSNSVVANNL